MIFSLFCFPGDTGGNWTERTVKTLSLRDKIGQLIQIRVPGKFINRLSSEYREIEEQIKNNHVGGVVLFAGNVYESAILLNQLQAASRLPLLVAADFERGLSFRIADTTAFPWTMAVGATGSEEYAYQQGLITGQESRALGVHWIFAPVLDVNNNPDNPVINIRAFGEDPSLVGRLGSAFIRGARKAQVLTTAKHFPGHGDTSTDSHLGLAVVESNLARLQAVEFVPFKKAIEAGVDAIMTAHVAVPNLTNSPDVPATLSSKVLRDVLRNDLKFDGIIVTDALEMGGITESYWCGLAAVRALQAGADVLLLPPNATVAINEVERAVKRGDISEARINESLRKILNAKHRLGLQQKRTVSIAEIANIVASPQNIKLAEEIANHSITLVKDEPHLLPVNPLKNTRIFSLVLASDFESSPGAAFQSELRRQFASVRTAWGNARMSDELLSSIDRGVSESDLVICSTLARLSSGQNSIAMPPAQQAILKRLAASPKPFIFISFGNPYVLRLAPDAGTYICTFSYSEISQIAAAKAIAGEIPITGRMPVSIPGYSKIGDGLQIPVLPMTLNWAENSGRFGASRKILESFIENGTFKRAELLVGYRNEVAADFRVGATAPGNTSPESKFELASLSTVVGALSAAMLATDSGILLPGTLLRDYLPELPSQGAGSVQVQDLLGRFSPNNATLLSRIVTRASGIPWDSFLTKNVFDPLGIKPGKPISQESIFLRGRDLAIFSQMLLNRGMYAHRRYFKPETIARYTGVQGWWTKPRDLDWTGHLFSSSAFGHVSTSGPALWIDPAKQVFTILLTDLNAKGSEAIDEAQKKMIESVMLEFADSE